MDCRIESGVFVFESTPQKSKSNRRGSLRLRIDLNRKEFYDKHPDLAPRNVYLSTGRVLKMGEVRDYINNIGEPWYKKLYNRLSKGIKSLISKNKL